MNLKIEHGELSWSSNDGDTFIHTVQEWSQFFFWRKNVKWNWFTFTPIKLSFEKDEFVPGYEAEIMLMGLGLRFRFNRGWEGTDLQESINEIEEGEKKCENCFGKGIIRKLKKQEDIRLPEKNTENMFEESFCKECKTGRRLELESYKKFPSEK